MNDHTNPCPDFERALARLADGELREVLEARRVQDHVADCAGCRAELDELRQTGDLLADALGSSPLAGLEGSIGAKVRSELGYTAQLREAVAAVASREPEPAPAPRTTPSGRLIDGAASPQVLRWIVPLAAACAIAIGLRLIDTSSTTETPVARIDPAHLANQVGRWPGRESGARAAVLCADGKRHAVSRGTILHAGDELWNDGPVGTFVELADGSRLALGAGAGLRLAAADRVELLGASEVAAASVVPAVFCEVTKRVRGQRPFTVRAGSTVVTVLGTRFTVAGLLTTRVSVLEGRVRVASPLEAKVLAADEAARVDESEGFVHDIPVSLPNAVGWVPGYGNYRPEKTPEPTGPSRLPDHPPERTGPPQPGDPDVDMPVQPPRRD